MDERRTIELHEYELVTLQGDELTESEAQLLDRQYGAQVRVEPPSFRNDHRWQLTSQGWVGYIPLSPRLGLRLLPKTPLHNLFGMWEYAYRLKSFRFLDDLTGVASLDSFYEQLANILAKRVLDRARKGLHRAYLHRRDDLPFVRGRLDVRTHVQRPWAVRLPCDFHEHTADIEDNRLLSYTLWRIASSGICTERVLPTVRAAYRSVQGVTTFQPFGPGDCVNRRYNRLNQDYHPLHALSRFFLEQTGPTHRVGDRPIMPFLVDMARLFELFVAEWLAAHLPAGWRVQSQERFVFGQTDSQRFQIDLVLRHRDDEQTVMVLDTKYKTPDAPSGDDVSQVVAYAEALGCTEAALIYPVPLKAPLNATIGHVHVRSLTFSLDGDLEEAGQTLLRRLFSPVPSAESF